MRTAAARCRALFLRAATSCRLSRKAIVSAAFLSLTANDQLRNTKSHGGIGGQRHSEGERFFQALSPLKSLTTEFALSLLDSNEGERNAIQELCDSADHGRLAKPHFSKKETSAPLAARTAERLLERPCTAEMPRSATGKVWRRASSPQFATFAGRCRDTRAIHVGHPCGSPLRSLHDARLSLLCRQEKRAPQRAPVRRGVCDYPIR